MDSAHDRNRRPGGLEDNHQTIKKAPRIDDARGRGRKAAGSVTFHFLLRFANFLLGLAFELILLPFSALRRVVGDGAGGFFSLAFRLVFHSNSFIPLLVLNRSLRLRLMMAASILDAVFDLIRPVVDATANVFAALSRPLLEFSHELIFLALEAIQIIIGEITPRFLDPPFELVPGSFHLLFFR